jgi:alpha-L-arabinofuranosidase
MASPVTVTIHADRPLGAVSPYIYGHFTEHLVNVMYDGMWSELVFGRKFETPMVGRLAHPIADPWRPFRPDAEGVTYWRGTGPVPRHSPSHGDCHHSQSVGFAAGHAGGEHGICAPDIRIDEGTSYVFRARVRRTGPAEELRVALRASDGAVIGETTLPVEPIQQTMFADLSFSVPTLLWMDPISWQEVEGTITATRTDHDAVLCLTVDVPAGDEAMVWFDWVSLLPADNADGWHRGVVDELTALPARMLKWPGGCMADDYDWRLGVGPRDTRHCDIDRAWLAWDENDVGTDEFLQLCERIGAEPYLGVNAGSGSPELAAAWVEYVNGPATSEWGRVRAANGQPEPYGVRYWSIGNEQWGHFERGYVGPTGYAERYLRFAEAMRKVDPSIVLVAVGKNGPFNDEVLKIAGPSIDLLQIHHYAPEVEGDDAEKATARILAARTFDTELATAGRQIAAAGADHVRIALDEWGWGRPNHAGAMFNAVALNAMQRAGSFVALGSRSCVLNADGVATRLGEQVTRNDVYEVFRLYNAAHLAQAVAVETDDDALDVSALADEAGAVSLFVVNTDGAERQVVVGGAGSDLHVRLVAAGPAGPWGPSAATASLSHATVERITIPPHSLAVLTTGRPA